MCDPLVWVLVVVDTAAAIVLVAGRAAPRVRELIRRHRNRRWVRTMARPVLSRPPIGQDGPGSPAAAGVTRSAPVTSAAPQGRRRIEVGSL